MLEDTTQPLVQLFFNTYSESQPEHAKIVCFVSHTRSSDPLDFLTRFCSSTIAGHGMLGVACLYAQVDLHIG
jgi:hypothetical protein